MGMQQHSQMFPPLSIHLSWEWLHLYKGHSTPHDTDLSGGYGTTQFWPALCSDSGTKAWDPRWPSRGTQDPFQLPLPESQLLWQATYMMD